MKEIIVKENQELTLPIVWFGQEQSIDYAIHLAGRGSKVTLLGLLLGNKAQSLDIKTNIYHENTNTKSEVVLKGALTDTARVNFEGLVKIENGAKGTNAWLAAHLLLLSDKAKGRTIPSLEILENDIKAGHATTVGKVSDLELFYLMSRGLSKEEAKQLIVEGFLQSLVARFPLPVKKTALLKLRSYSMLQNYESRIKNCDF